MIRPRFALLASLIALCWSLAGNGSSAKAQIIFPVPSTTQSDLLLAELSPPIHTCALPADYYVRLHGGPLEIIQTATVQLGQQVAESAASAWEGISERWEEQNWNAVIAAESSTLPKVRPVSAVKPTTVRPSSPDFCPLASLLDTGIDAASVADESLSSTADQLPELCGLESVFFDTPDLATVAPMPFTLESINRAPRASNRTLDSAINSGAKDIEATATALEPVCSWMASQSLIDAGYWLTQQVANSQSWLGETFGSIVLADTTLTAPPQSDPGAPAVRPRVATIIVTPFGPMAASVPLRSNRSTWQRNNPLRDAASPASKDIATGQAWDQTIELISHLNPLRPWQTWVEVTAEELVADALNRGLELADIVQQGNTTASSPPPLPEISKPSVFSASAIRAEEDDDATDWSEAWVDESLLPLDPAWLDYPCPCDRALDEYERKSRTAMTISSAAAATNAVPAQSLGNIVTALQDASLRQSQKIGLKVNQQHDGLTRPAQAQSIAPTRALSRRNARFGLAAGFVPGRRVRQQETLLNLEQLEMVNVAAERLGLATGRVAQGFQEAAGILLNSLEARPEAPRTAGNSGAPASR